MNTAALQLVVSTGAMHQRMVDKETCVSRVVQVQFDMESGYGQLERKFDSVAAILCLDKPALVSVGDSKSLECNSSKVVPYHDTFFENHPAIMVKPQLSRPTRMMQVLQHLPLPTDIIEDVLLPYLGYETLGITLPRVFVQNYMFGLEHYRNPPPFPISVMVDEKATTTPPNPVYEKLLYSKNAGGYMIEFDCYEETYPEYQLYVERKELTNTTTFHCIFNGQILFAVNAIWLLTNSETTMIRLPWPSLYSSICHLVVSVDNFGTKVPALYRCISPNARRRSVFGNLDRWVIQIHASTIIPYQNGVSSLRKNANHLCFRIIAVLCYKGQAVRRRQGIPFTHPIKSLGVNIIDIPDMTGDGDYFEQVLPLMYGAPTSSTHVIYQIIFHPPPLNYGDDNVLGVSRFYSTLNLARIESIGLRVEWDTKVVQHQFTQPEFVALHTYIETFNVLRHQWGIIGQLFY